MRNRWVITVTLAALAITATAQAQEEPSQTDRKIPIEVKMIWDAAPHNAFTDLIRWQGSLYCAFRIGNGHAPRIEGDDGKIQVIRSDDQGVSWTAVETLVEKDIDLRDPKLSITPTGQLMLLMGGSNYDGGRLVDSATRVAFLSNKDSKFSKIETVKIDPQIASSRDWLWRVTWRQDVGYGVVYQRVNAQRSAVHLVATRDGREYRLVKSFGLTGRPNESTIRFQPNGEMRVVVRNELGGISHLGIAAEPYTDFRWQDIKMRLGGPDLIRLPDGRWVLGTRQYGRAPQTMLGLLDDQAGFQKWITFPSGGDTSYPGMVVDDEKLWVSYYASQTGRASIYLATINLADLPPPQN